MIWNRIATNKNGSASYSTPGFTARLVMKKTLFKDGNAPETLELVGDNFAEPGATKERVSSEEAIAKAQEAASKAVERAEKARVKAEKASARLAKMIPSQAKAEAATTVQ
jgi:hypothetical protein